MNTNKLIPAWLVGFIVMFILSFIWYGLVISGYNAEAMKDVIRGEETFSMLKIGIGYLIFSFFLAYIYPKGYSGGSAVQEGLRYGIFMGLFMSLGLSIIYSGAYKFPLGAQIIDALYHTVEITVGSIVIAKMYGEGSAG